MTDTGVVVGASLVSSGTKHVPVVRINPTDQSIFIRKGGTVGVLQSVPRIEVFNVPDGNMSREGYVESRQVFSKPTSEQLPRSLSVKLNCLREMQFDPLSEIVQTFLLRPVLSWVRLVLQIIGSIQAMLTQSANGLDTYTGGQQEIKAREVQSMLHKDIIEASTSLRRNMVLCRLSSIK